MSQQAPQDVHLLLAAGDQSRSAEFSLETAAGGGNGGVLGAGTAPVSSWSGSSMGLSCTASKDSVAILKICFLNAGAASSREAWDDSSVCLGEDVLHGL